MSNLRMKELQAAVGQAQLKKLKIIREGTYEIIIKDVLIENQDSGLF